MRRHIFLALIALMVSACASHESVSQKEINLEREEQFSFREGAASRVR